jgi:uncharacterized membrane protein YraQ (UPF0718 family)
MPWGRVVENEHKPSSHGHATAVNVVEIPFDEKRVNALRFAWYLGKQILPFFFIGLVVVSYVQAFMPEDVVVNYLTGVRGILLASVIGGPLYTPTLVEIVLGRGLLNLGMSQAALLSWFMGQPYDIPNMMAASKIVRWKVVVSYALIAWVFSVIFGLSYGLATGKM